MDTIGTETSLGLQYGVPLRVFVDKFSHTRFEPSGWTHEPGNPARQERRRLHLPLAGDPVHPRLPRSQHAATARRERHGRRQAEAKNGATASTVVGRHRERRHPKSTAAAHTNGNGNGKGRHAQRRSPDRIRTVPQSAANSSPVFRPMPLLATIVAQSRSATATAICATIVGTAWDVADGSAASPASAPWSSEGPGCFFACRCATRFGIRQDFQRPAGHGGVVVLRVDGGAAAVGELHAACRILHQLLEGTGQVFGIARLDEEAAAGRFQHFGKRPVPRLHNRHAVGQRLQDVQSLRLAVDCRNGENVERFEELAPSLRAFGDCRRTRTPAPGRGRSRESSQNSPGRASRGSRPPAAGVLGCRLCNRRNPSTS